MIGTNILEEYETIYLKNCLEKCAQYHHLSFLNMQLCYEIFIGQGFVPGHPDLPVNTYYSCVTEVEPDIVFISGLHNRGKDVYLIC